MTPNEKMILEFMGDKKLKIEQLRKQLNAEKSYPGSFKTVTQLKDFLTNRPHLFVITDYYVQRYQHYNQDKIEQEQVNYNHPDTIQPQMDPLQNQSSDYISWLCDPKQSLVGDPAMVLGEDLEKQLEFTGLMSSLPVAAEVASDLESDPPSGLPATIRPQMDPGAAEAASDLESEVVGTKVIY